jgi:hypothetical protein
MTLASLRDRINGKFTGGTKSALAFALAGTAIRYGAAVIGKELDERREKTSQLEVDLADTRLQLWALETILHNREIVTPEEFKRAYEDGRVLHEAPLTGREQPPDAPQGAPGEDLPAGAIAVPAAEEQPFS